MTRTTAPRSRSLTPAREGFFLPAVLLAALLVGAALAPAPAQAQDIRAQVQRLQQELQTLQRAVYGGAAGGQASGGAAAAAGGDLNQTQAARLEVRMNQLESQMRNLTGQVEQVGYRIDQASRKLDGLAEQFEQRLARLEQQQLTGGQQGGDGYVGGSYTPPDSYGDQAGGGYQSAPATDAAGNQYAPGETGPQTLGSVPAQTLDQVANQAQAQPGIATQSQPTQLGQAQAQPGQTQQANRTYATPKEQYDYAFTLLSQANYPEAEQALAAFLQAYPQDPLAGNAKYWLGETHYVRGQYREAAVTFAEGYQDYPNSSKAPDNLLKLAKSLAALGQNADACGTLAELQSRYPTASSNVLQQAQREQQRLGC